MKKGIVLMNLGSPDSTQVKDVRKYLDEFLMDERVIDYPKLLRTLLVKGIIVPFRSPKSAEAYKSIWTEQGSPLIVLTKTLQVALSQNMPEHQIEIAMRYGNPSVKTAFDNLGEMNIDQVLAIPLYPHYAMSSYETAVAYAQKIHKEGNYPFSLEFIKPYYNNEKYIHALSESIRPYLAGEYEHILFSYHGVPERQIRKGDPTGCHCLKVNDCCNVDSPAHAKCYRNHCHVTTQMVTKKLGIPEEKYTMSFQSRLGKEEWLKPYT
ncbi:MAG: ferrochelatase, partial [Chitinophagaceae bacterium]